MKYIYPAILAMLIALSACERKGQCVEVTVQGKVKHHSRIIPFATVYIKFDSKDAPQDLRNPKVYDDSAKADANADYLFTRTFKEGDYYLYGVGFDDASGETVYGGMPLNIVCNPQSETITVNIPVVE